MMQAKVQSPQWTRSQRGLSWLSFAVFVFGMILFMVGYTGNSWYVSPVDPRRYPPDSPIQPINFGLFYLCYRGECKYDLRQDYQIVQILPQELDITWAYQNYRTVCMAIVTVGAVLALLAIGCYLLFLSDVFISLICGYVAAGLQILSALIIFIGVIIFGQKFYGAQGVSPFGWSFGLTIVGAIFFLLNGIVLIIHTVFIQLYVSRMHFQAASRTRAPSSGFLGFFRNCC